MPYIRRGAPPPFPTRGSSCGSAGAMLHSGSTSAPADSGYKISLLLVYDIKAKNTCLRYTVHTLYSVQYCTHLTVQYSVQY